jgi:hypothetical protein
VPEPLYYYVLSAGQLHRAGMDRYDEARRRILVKHFGVDWEPSEPTG